MKAALLALALVVAGCTGPNTNIRAIQLNGAAEPLPENYLATVADVLEDREPADGGAFLVSEPMRYVGASVFDPQRWYVCIRGVETRRAPNKRLPPLWTLAERVVAPEMKPQGVFEIVIMFRRSGLAGVEVKEVFDSAMCRKTSFSSLPLR